MKPIKEIKNLLNIGEYLASTRGDVFDTQEKISGAILLMQFEIIERLDRLIELGEAEAADRKELKRWERHKYEMAPGFTYPDVGVPCGICGFPRQSRIHGGE